MKVLLVSTSERTGGGAIAARRLMEALAKNNVEVKMMVRDKQTNDPRVVRVGNKIPKLLERLAILPHIGFNRSRLWQADIANTGISITTTPEFQEADIIHLHWINQGMISLDEMGKIMSRGKRIIWTLHDEWAYLGVCHYRGNCTEKECQNCPLLSGTLPHSNYIHKHEMYHHWHPTFVGCSKWIAQEAQKAMPEEQIHHINNCIPANLFRPTDMQQARKTLSLPADKQLILFCSQKATDERKGMKYLAEALQKLQNANLHLVIVGKDSEQIPLPDGIEATHFGSVGEEMMPQLYNAVDVFVTPSLQDNLPNTIAEAMSCGTPCVGFDIGGIPEMIDHLQNGYVARYRQTDDLAAGIRYVLSHDLRQNARLKAASAYDETSVAQQYIKLYQA